MVIFGFKGEFRSVVDSQRRWVLYGVEAQSELSEVRD